MLVRTLLSAALVLGACADDGNKKSGAAAEPSIAPKPLETLEIDAGSAQAQPHEAKAVPQSRIETIQFPAEDGLLVTADLYLWHQPNAPFVVLFHQAGWSRGEYKEIAPKLGELGFNCMAVDQRSGGEVNQVRNATNALATSEGRATKFPDALLDMRAALRLVKTRFPDAKRFAWGSSYSSALTLVLAGTEPELMDAALAFSPGEYFARFGKSKTFVTDAAKSISMPVFVTGSKEEHAKWKTIFAAIPDDAKTGFVPTTKGNHGSRALWEKFSDSEEYWEAVRAFLEEQR